MLDPGRRHGRLSLGLRAVLYRRQRCVMAAPVKPTAQPGRRDRDRCADQRLHVAWFIEIAARHSPLPSTPGLCAHMQFVLTIVDDESAEHPQRIHAVTPREYAMVIRSCRKSMKMRLFVSPAEPRIPSAPPIASGTMGSTGESTATSPTLKESTRMVGTVANPVTPRRVTGGDRSVGMPSANATRAVTAECEAPVSSTSRKGPRP